MDISIIGLGLIGGSFARAIKKYTKHNVFGFDTNSASVEMAKADGSIDRESNFTQLPKMDMVIVCLHPRSAIKFITENADKFKKGCIVADSCGVKESVVNACAEVLCEKGVHFIGAHPMAGRERFGYEASLADLFLNASMILTPVENTNENAVSVFEKLCKDIGFGKVVKTTPQHHDKVIAYTSQLAHVVSNAYVKSPMLFNRNGYSAGSFLDLTRVARLDENMWTELFLYNKEALLCEIDIIIESLKTYRDAIANDEEDYLREILREGRILKEKSLEE